nr:hypothetical protein [Candidatus Sigynarchaeota archaeon]
MAALVILVPKNPFAPVIASIFCFSIVARSYIAMAGFNDFESKSVYMPRRCSSFVKSIPYGQRPARRKIIALVLVILAPFAFCSYISSCVGSVLAFEKTFRSFQVNYDALIPGNYTRLVEMADEFEFNMNDHLPLNYTLSLYWNQDFTNISEYEVSWDAAIWSGMTLAMASFKYATMKREGNATQLADALSLVKRLTSGVSLLLAVPNGGIGPEYPGVLARSVSPKNWSLTHAPIAGYPYGQPADHVDFFDGAGNYSDWFWIGYPSLDQYSGIIMGVTTAAAIVDDPWVQARVKLLATQMLEHFKRTNWYLTDGNGRTTGQSFLWMPEHTGAWLLATIFMGVLVDPEAYTPLYYHWAFERGYADPAVLANDLSIFTLFNYYSMNINWVITYALSTFETTPVLRAAYQRLLRDSMYPVVRNHRNAWFNMAYLHAMGINDSSISKDVVDQLMRFDIERIPGQANSTRLPERGLNATGSYFTLVPSSWPRRSFTQWLGTQWIYPPRWMNLASNFIDDDEFLAEPKTVDLYQCVDFLWQRTPWTASRFSPA